MKRIALLTTFIILLITTGSYSQPYPQNYFGHPVDTPFLLAGTFGEIRTDHFHTGLDFSTRKEVDKPVYASADGFVSRVKVASGGYGKALYVTHPNGYITVYAHLKNFSEAIEKFTRKVQYKNERFEVDEILEPGKIRVKKGSVIARSGNSGSSTGPHLHFEIRDEKTEEPLNPLLFGFQIADTVKPEINAVRFYPVPGQGIVIDSDLPRTYEVEQGPSVLSIRTPEYIQVFGKIGFELSMTDYQNQNISPLGIYSVQLSVDTQQIFSMKYDRLNFNDTRYVNAHIDYEAKYDGEGIFERCFRVLGDKLKLYGDTINNGYFEFYEEGVHEVTFTVKDFAGNTSVLSFPLLSYSTLANAEFRPQPENYFAMLPDKGLAIHKSDLEIVIPANSIYEMLLFTHNHSPRKPGYFSPEHEIGDPRVPLHLPVTVSLKPHQLPDGLKPKAMVVSINKKGKPVYEGNAWNNEFISAKTKHFGTYAVAVDTILPSIELVSLPTDKNPEGPALRVKITDDLSGIKTYRTLLDDHWFLMEYDAKNNLLTAGKENFKAGKKHLLEITVTDAVGNAATFKTEINY